MKIERFKRLDVCWEYATPKDFRENNPIGSGKNDNENELISHWHKKIMVVIDKESYVEPPYMCQYGCYNLFTGQYGAWTYSNRLEKICQIDEENYRKFLKKNNQL